MAYQLILLFLMISLTACSTTTPSSTNSNSAKAAINTQTISRKAPSDYTLKTGGELMPLQQGLSMKHVELHFTLLPEKKSIKASATLLLKATKKINQFSLDLDTAFTINHVLINQQPLSINDFKNATGELIINLPTEMQGNFKVTIDYQGQPLIAKNAPWDGGFVWSKTAKGDDWIATAVQGEGCDIFWPCIDNQQVEIESSDIFITVKQPLVAASNGQLVDVKHSNHFSTYHWQTKTPMNAYALSLNIGPYKTLTSQYKSIYGNTLDLVYYHLPRKDDLAQKLFNELPTMLDFFERTFGPYPFPKEKVGIVETPHLGMEHQTINAYGNHYKKDSFGFDWLMQHEFSHEWFGNQLTNNNWDHMWLHEGFGSYMQPLYAQYLHGDQAYQTYLHQQREKISNRAPIVSNKMLTEEDVYNPKYGPGLDIYVKGSLILHTLRNLIGDDDFFNATKRLVYGTTHPTPNNIKPRFSDTNEFIAIVNKVTGKNLQWFFDVYLFQAKLPKLETKRSKNQFSLHWNTPNNLPFPMPVELSINGKIVTLLMNKDESINITDKDIIIVDPASKLLKQEQAIDDFQQYKKQQWLKKQANKLSKKQ